MPGTATRNPPEAAMLELLRYSFMQYALLAGGLVSLASAYFGVFIVQRKMAFLGHGLAHAAFGGVALALLLGQQPLWIAIPFTIAVALLITWISEHSTLALDTVIGVLFALAMALGIVFISQLPTYAADAFSYLFGSILAVQTTDLLAAGAVALLALLSLPLWGRWAYATLDREAALADRLPVRLDNYLLAVLTAAAIVVSAKLVGIVLLSAFLITPAASARLVTTRFSTMTLIALAFGLLTTLGGLAASYLLDWPSGATIILVQTLLFGVCLLSSWLPRKNSARQHTGCPAHKD
jgi:zinc transport system permease protein